MAEFFNFVIPFCIFLYITKLKVYFALITQLNVLFNFDKLNNNHPILPNNEKVCYVLMAYFYISTTFLSLSGEFLSLLLWQGLNAGIKIPVSVEQQLQYIKIVFLWIVFLYALQMEASQIMLNGDNICLILILCHTTE